MPLVDTGINLGVAKASRFGLLQHPIMLTSQMATSAVDSKATERILRCGKIARGVRTPREAAFNNPDRYSSA
jgi:hypothetical protein